MMLVISFFFYFFCLSLFSLVSHPVYYCVLLILNSLVCSFICYSVYGFSWYALLFCLVYIGGVYILFVFVSVHSPNSSVISYWNFNYLGGYLVIFCLFLFSLSTGYVLMPVEASSFLCTCLEGYFYLCMCLTLLFGFCVLSLVMAVKTNHYR
uniref:NADH dehydrogenase subunit 6 n=1 Tax=Rhinebothrium sp. MZUSP 8018 TaxID=2899480 RepID=A0A8K1SXM5_9CEST|nr:NADH dehydrogenase subunit 6 [Rhinebothrium sp. MZUSP 8018]